MRLGGPGLIPGIGSMPMRPMRDDGVASYNGEFNWLLFIMLLGIIALGVYGIYRALT